MKREDVKTHIEGITDEQLNWLMEENGKDIEAYKAYKKELETTKSSLAEVQGKLTKAESDLSDANTRLSGFEGVDIEALKNENTSLKDQVEAIRKQSVFDRKLDGAILSANGRNVTACRSLLGEERINSLRDSENPDDDIKKAIDECVTANPWAFKDSSTGNMTVNLGGDNSGGNKMEEIDGVTKRFIEMNPDLAKKV